MAKAVQQKMINVYVRSTSAVSVSLSLGAYALHWGAGACVTERERSRYLVEERMPDQTLIDGIFLFVIFDV